MAEAVSFTPAEAEFPVNVLSVCYCWITMNIINKTATQTVCQMWDMTN